MGINMSAPNPRELLIVKGHYHGQAFVCIGIIREQGGKRAFVSTMGEKLPWGAVSKWDYLRDVAPLYDIWSPEGTLFSMNPTMGPKHESAEARQA